MNNKQLCMKRILYTTQYIESIFCGYSELAFRHPSMITGWYGALSNTD